MSTELTNIRLRDRVAWNGRPGTVVGRWMGTCMVKFDDGGLEARSAHMGPGMFESTDVPDPNPPELIDKYIDKIQGNWTAVHA